MSKLWLPALVAVAPLVGAFAAGGWGFEAFAGDSRTERLVGNGGKSCFGCHMAAKDTAYVFTAYRE